MRAAIYARVSTHGQEETGSSLGTQEAACRAFVTEQGWTISEEHVYREVYTGAELYDRRALTALRDAMKRRAVDVLVCHAIDRLSRDPVHLGVILTEADHDGVAVQFVTEPLDNTPEGQLIRFVRGYAAKVEREKFRERSMRGKRAVLQSGRLVGSGTHLYGYRNDKERGTRLVEESEAAVVRQMFDWVAVEGCSIRAVTRRLRERGIPPPGTGKFAYRDMAQDRQWGPSQVDRMLRNPAYKGESYALRFTADHHKRGRPDVRPPDEWFRLPDGLTPAIVTPTVWDAVQQRLATNRGDATRSVRLPALLRGHIFCPFCNRRMYPEMDHGHLRYRCGSRTALVGCPATQVTAAAIEAWAWERVAAKLANPRSIAAGVAMEGASTMTDALARDRATARRELAKIERQQDRLLDRFGASDDPAFPWEIVERRISALQTDRVRWQQVLQRSDTALASAKQETRQERDLMAWCARAAANLATFTFDDKRLALDVLGVRVVAAGRDPDDWRIGYAPNNAP